MTKGTACMGRCSSSASRPREALEWIHPRKTGLAAAAIPALTAIGLLYGKPGDAPEITWAGYGVAHIDIKNSPIWTRECPAFGPMNGVRGNPAGTKGRAEARVQEKWHRCLPWTTHYSVPCALIGLLVARLILRRSLCLPEKQAVKADAKGQQVHSPPSPVQTETGAEEQASGAKDEANQDHGD
jgi:hypothetical protein